MKQFYFVMFFTIEGRDGLRRVQYLASVEHSTKEDARLKPSVSGMALFDTYEGAWDAAQRLMNESDPNKDYYEIGTFQPREAEV